MPTGCPDGATRRWERRSDPARGESSDRPNGRRLVDPRRDPPGSPPCAQRHGTTRRTHRHPPDSDTLAGATRRRTRPTDPVHRSDRSARRAPTPSRGPHAPPEESCRTEVVAQCHHHPPGASEHAVAVHGGEVLRPLLDERPRPIGDRIRQTDAAAIEQHDSPDRRQTVQQSPADRVPGRKSIGTVPPGVNSTMSRVAGPSRTRNARWCWPEFAESTESTGRQSRTRRRPSPEARANPGRPSTTTTERLGQGHAGDGGRPHAPRLRRPEPR